MRCFALWAKSSLIWGNLAAAALLFGKALALQEVPTLALVIGGMAFVGLYAFGIILVYLGEEE